MVKIFGEFNDKELKSREFIKLIFSPSSVPLQQRWRNNSLSADFLADYLMTLFHQDENDPKRLEKQIEIKDTISYIANELLENAMKFNDDSSPYPISIQLHLYDDRLSLCISNSIPAAKVAQFQSFINKLLSTEPQDFYIQQIETAEKDGSISSGLGLLTIIDDYGAKLGWKFENLQLLNEPNYPLYYIKNQMKWLNFWFRVRKWFVARSKNPNITIVTTMVQLAI